jgi:hypothetical protein
MALLSHQQPSANEMIKRIIICAIPSPTTSCDHKRVMRAACSVQQGCVTLSSLSFRPLGVVLFPVGARNAAVVAEVPEIALTEGTQKNRPFVRSGTLT